MFDSCLSEFGCRRRQGKIQRPAKSFDTYEAADKFAKDTELAMDERRFIDTREADDTTLAAVLLDYKNGRGLELKDPEIGTRIDKLIERNPECKRLSMANVSQKYFTDFIADRRKEVSDATVRRELDIFSTAINRAIASGLNIRNPIDNIDRPPKTPGRDRRLHPGELEKILAAMKPQPRGKRGQLGSGCRNPFIRWITLFAIETAMRQSEIANLTWNNTHLDRYFVHLPDTKIGEKRDVPLSRFAERILKIVKRIGDQNREKVFPVTANAIKQAYSDAVDRAGIEDLTFHDLRHEGTSRLALIYQMHELAKVVGHKDLQTTMRYYHPRLNDLIAKLRERN